MASADGAVPPRLGVVVLPEYDWPRTRQIWREAEDLGFAHGWTYDHLSWRTLRGRPWYDSFTTLTAVAAVTRRLRLGTLVASPNFRHPVPTAHQVMTVDQISGGRFVYGIGAGAAGTDEAAVGAPPEVRRTRRFEEFVTISDRLLRQPRTTYEGSVTGPWTPTWYPAACNTRGFRSPSRRAALGVSPSPPGTRRPGSPSARPVSREPGRTPRPGHCWNGRSTPWNGPARTGAVTRLDRPAGQPESAGHRAVRLGGPVRGGGRQVRRPGLHRRGGQPSTGGGVFAGDPAAFRRAVTAVVQARQVSGRPPL
ncbi:hypothetical protein GCM10027605_02140 [Micromonospora zhanjiangensis]